MKRIILVFAGLLTLTGCFTVSETPFPAVTFSTDTTAATNVAVAVRGFAAFVTDYARVDGFETIYYSGCGYRRHCGGGFAVAHSTSLVPQSHPTDAFLEQAKDRLEGLGFNVMAQTPDYVVEARFSGPVVTVGDVASSAAWIVLSLLTCDHGVQTWTARLKIHDNRTGKLILTRDYEQKYEVTGFSPIPLLGISYYDRTSSNHMLNWCLSALTDRMMADAATFITARK